MRLVLTAAATLALAACGGADTQNPAGKELEDAAAQSDPAAGAVLNQAAEMGMNEQQALELAGRAASANAQAAGNSAGPVQAVPNTVQTPNRPDGTRPPAKGTGTTNVPGLQQGGEPRQPQPSGGQH
ncbi:MAG TPA: hypothetical protein VM913_01240 [Sphingomicrobium sp.]|jgi:hypothetical protein|nr:hypothetical protein [Sphingomicrobium sp.]